MIIEETFEREKLYAFAASSLRERGAKRILDLGCADGGGTATLSGRGFTITAVDLSEKLIREAGARHGTPDLTFITADATKTGLPHASFDAVVSFHLIEHLDLKGQMALLREIKRVLRPKGLLLIATPDRDVWELQGIAGQQEDHVREINRVETQALLEEAGFAVRGVYGQDLLKKKNFTLRRMLNFLKRLDIFRARRLLMSEGTLGKIDAATQPVEVKGDVILLGPNDHASVTIFECSR